MKRSIILKLTAVIVVMMTLFLTSCTWLSQMINGDESEAESVVRSGDIVIIACERRNMPPVNLRMTEVYDVIHAMAYGYYNCKVVTSEGEPEVAYNYVISKPRELIDDSKRLQLADENTDTIINAAQALKAKTPEANPLGALICAGEELQYSKNEKTVIIYENGLQTTGILNFLEKNLINTDVSEIIKQLKDKHSVPELQGVKVIWVGIGEVAGTQSTLPESYRYKLKEIWRAIINEGGGSVDFIRADGGEYDESDLPTVSAVPVVQDSLTLQDTISEVEKEVIVDPIRFDETTLKFKPDSSELCDSSAAENALRPIADIMKKHENVKIVVAGMTASVGSEEGCRSLSEQRAGTCKEMLVKLGANPEKIICTGLGRSQNCLRVDDLDASGNLIERYASQNRAIYIFDADSDTASSILR